MPEGGRHDSQTIVQRQLILRILPENLVDQVRASVSGSGGSAQDIQIYRDEEQPSPAFYPASNERMTFQIQNRKYPASLVDLPCPVETHRTFDLMTIYKSSDISQILIVYEDDEARLQAEADMRPKKGKFYGNPDGLTPPTSNIAKRRFIPAKNKLSSFSKKEVEAAEAELITLFDGWKSESSNKASSLVGQIPEGAVKISDEEEVVDFEEYMWSERSPQGVRVEEDSKLAKLHPEIFLPRPKDPVRKAEREEKNKRNVPQKPSSALLGEGKGVRGKSPVIRSITPVKKGGGEGGSMVDDEENLVDALFSGDGTLFDFEDESDMNLSQTNDNEGDVSMSDSIKPQPPTASATNQEPTTANTQSNRPMETGVPMDMVSETTAATNLLSESNPNPNPQADPQAEKMVIRLEDDAQYVELMGQVQAAEREKATADDKLKEIQAKTATTNIMMRQIFEKNLKEAKESAEACNKKLLDLQASLKAREDELRS